MGGLERVIETIVLGLDRRRYDVEVWCLARGGAIADELRSLGVPVKIQGLTSYYNPARVRELAARLAAGRFDVVHAHSPLLAGAARVLARTLPHRPVTVSTEHNVWSSFLWPTRLLNALTTGLDAQRWAVSEEVHRSMGPRARRGATVLVHGIVLGGDSPEPATRGRVRAAAWVGELVRAAKEIRK